MAQFRRPEQYESPFAQVPNNTLEDPDLSWKAKGIMSYLLSKSDNWDVYQEQLSDVGPDGRTATRSGIQELRDHGYLERRKLRTDDGQFQEYEYIIRPFGGNPPNFYYTDDGKPDFGKSDIGSPDIGDSNTTNKESTNTESTNTDTTSNDVGADAPDSKFLQLCSGDDSTDVKVTSTSPEKSSRSDTDLSPSEIKSQVREISEADDLGSMGWRLGVLFRRLFAPWWDDDKLRENLSRLIREAKRLIGERAPDGSVISKERAYQECAKAIVYLYQERDDLHGRSDPDAQKDQPVAALNVLSKHISLEFDGTDEENEAELSEIEKAVRNA